MPPPPLLLDFHKADWSAVMDVLDAIHHRRAIRAFTSEAVEKEVIESLVDAAVHAPNAGLGTCWIGFAEAWLNRPEAKKSFPATFRPIAPVISGYPRTRPNPPERHRPDMIWIEP
jgi:nitroreductase